MISDKFTPQCVDNSSETAFKDMIESLRNKLDDFNKEYDEDLKILDFKKKEYFDEFNKYELFIINKELGLLETMNDNEIKIRIKIKIKK